MTRQPLVLTGFESGAPARPPLRVILAATSIATVALVALVGLGTLTGHLWLIPVSYTHLTLPTIYSV